MSATTDLASKILFANQKTTPLINNNGQYGANVNRLKSVFFSSSTQHTAPASASSSSSTSSSTSSSINLTTSPIMNVNASPKLQPPPLPPKNKSKYSNLINGQQSDMNEFVSRSRSLSSRETGLENDANAILNKGVLVTTTTTPSSPTKINGIYIDQFLPNTSTINNNKMTNGYLKGKLY